MKDFADFLVALNSEDVRYVVIGGMAVLSYVPYRTTRDIDVLIEPTLDNAKAARRAVQAWGSFESAFSPEEFLSGDVLSFGGLLRVEIHSHLPGFEWADLWRDRVSGELAGVRTHFASLHHLIEMKERAGREEKDLPDLKRLRRLRDQD